MAGIYLHIPFCKQACHYCNFHFTTSLRYKSELAEAMVKEIALQKEYLGGETINTIYFGGGTPSLLDEKELEEIMSALRQAYVISENAEVTLEANPDDITSEKLQFWKRAGINRLSIGIQSFFEEELRWMNRAHNAQQARQCIVDSLAAGITNLSIDLIYGSPLLSDEDWKRNVDLALSYHIPHLSCYALTVEEKTPLHKMIRTQQKVNVNEEQQARQFLLLMQWLRAAGYEHYEVSNFAKPGYRSRHNSSYWKGESYLGIGPSAHSYNGKSRSWNVANNQLYIEAINEGRLPKEEEKLTRDEKLNEYMMIALRTMEGIDMQRVRELASEKEADAIIQKLKIYASQRLVSATNTSFALTDDGMLRADGMAGELFV